MKFAEFMHEKFGRGFRIVAGLILIGVGLVTIQGFVGAIVATLGLAVFLAGALDFCMIAPLLKVPFSGKNL